jgi:hypothetical protein
VSETQVQQEGWAVFPDCCPITRKQEVGPEVLLYRPMS